MIDRVATLGIITSMAVNPDTTVRKIFSMPREMAERVDAFRKSHGAQSEADALRRLIETGLMQYETAEELKERCAKALSSGKTFGWIMQNILEPHPRVFSVSLDEERLFIVMKDDDFITYYRQKDMWETI